MREPPSGVSDAQVLASVREHWDAGVVRVEHLPVGFGAHHWRADAADGPRLFVTLDTLAPRHSAETLEATYAATGALAGAGLEFVVAPLPSHAGTRTVAVAGGALSVTPWVDGASGSHGAMSDRAAAEETATLLRRLHAVRPPTGIRPWEPVVGRRFAAELALSLGTPWTAGPYGERVRATLADRLGDIGRWVGAYLRLAATAAERPWVATHGEPHAGNQMVTATGRRVLVDWESLRLAPAELDLRLLTEQGYADLCDPDWSMVEMFDLQWRLDEIASYSRWFAGPHPGSQSDEVAYGGLRGELDRPDWRRPD